MDPESETQQLPSAEAILTLFPSLDTSQCGGTVVGYEFCSQYMNNTGSASNRGTIFTLLVLEDVGSNYTVLRETTFMEPPPSTGICQGVNDGGVCCMNISLDPSEQFAATSPNLSYATMTPTTADAMGNVLLEFDEETLGYAKVATLYTFRSSSVTKAQLEITNSSELSSVRRKRFRFLIEGPQPSQLTQLIVVSH